MVAIYSLISCKRFFIHIHIMVAISALVAQFPINCQDDSIFSLIYFISS